MATSSKIKIMISSRCNDPFPVAAKTQSYCQIANLSEQVEQAAQEKDRKKVEELLQKIIELEKQLGPEYLALVDALFNNNNMDPNSKDDQEIVSMFDRFDETYRH
jgi:cobalamin biosynthesis Mg chelatase CobN